MSSSPKNMYFLQQRKTRSHFWGRAGIGAALFVLLFTAFSRPEILTKLSLSFGAPLLEARATAADGAVFAGGLFGGKGALVAENMALKKEIATLRVKAELYDHARDAYDELRLLASGRVPREEKIARVLASPGVTPYDILILDIGTKAGVVKGNLVLSEAGVALGVVDTVSDTSAHASLFSSPETNVHAVLPGGFSGVLEGTGGGSFVMRVPKDIVVEAGDLITRTGTNDVLARVASVSTKDTDAFQTVRAVVPDNVFELSYVVVTDEVVVE